MPGATTCSNGFDADEKLTRYQSSTENKIHLAFNNVKLKDWYLWWGLGWDGMTDVNSFQFLKELEQ